MNQSDWARPKQAAQHLQVALSTLWEWARTRHDFPKPYKPSRRATYFKRSELDAWMLRQQVGK